MKKLVALLSLAVFFTVAVNAQSSSKSAPEVKKEASVKADAKADATPACCKKSNPSCCKNNKEAKACTPEQKAACAKAGTAKECSHAKGELEEKVKATEVK